MPRHAFRAMPVFLIVLLLGTGCASARTTEQADLLHRRFVLVSVDGAPFAAGREAPDIEFNEGFRVSARICNRHFGPGRLENGILTVERMASTRMACPDEVLRGFETLFRGMLAAGAELDFTGNTLTLRQGGNVLVYTVKDWVH